MCIDKKKYPRKSLLHLYNPKEEGLGSYDVHYMNAYKKELLIRAKHEINDKKVA